MTTEIQYPIFLKLSSRMVDSFYKYMYEDLSYGILPYGLYLQDNYLCCYLKHKEFSYKLGDDADIKEIHNLLKKSGILSEKDQIKQKETLMFEKNNNENKTSFTKKSFREMLIQNFIIDEGKKNHIHIDIIKRLFSFLNNAFLFKLLSFHNITFEENKIRSIDGITFQKSKVVINYEKFNMDNKISIQSVEIKKQNIWNIYLSFINEFNTNFKS